jgi:hypothetical protein
MRPTRLVGLTLTLAGLVALPVAPAPAADIVLNIVDPPGVGFNPD